MLVGVYSDLHSNWPALNQMIECAGNVEKWICLGDSVGLFPGVNEVIDWQRFEKPYFVQGDHEEALLNPTLKFTSFTANHSIDLQRKQISPINRTYLLNTTEHLSLNLENCSIFLTHFLSQEARIDANKYLFNLKSLDLLYGLYDVVFFGHTHFPLAIKGKTTQYYNPGSAGFPVTKDGKASFLIFDTKTQKGEHVFFNIKPSWLINSIKKNSYHKRLEEYIKNKFVW